jgi:uncharacterized metal-binding protein (TIGR02443 family)
VTRRFIAGAVCPRCGEQDKLLIDSETDQRECVKCGFHDQRPKEGGATELQTRVTRPAARRTETPVEAVTLIDPSNPSKETDQ